MSAWSAHISEAPKDGTQILMRHPEWQCPSVMKWSTEYEQWMFAEEALQDIDGSLIDTDGVEWSHLPN